MGEQNKVGGVESVIEMMKAMDAPTRERLLTELAARDPALAEKIRENLLGMEDLLRIEDLGIQRLLRELPAGLLVIALRNAVEPLKQRIFDNLSTRAREALREEIDALGPQALSKVLAAQAQLLAIAKRLHAEKEIVIPEYSPGG